MRQPLARGHELRRQRDVDFLADQLLLRYVGAAGAEPRENFLHQMLGRGGAGGAEPGGELSRTRSLIKPDELAATSCSR